MRPVNAQADPTERTLMEPRDALNAVTGENTPPSWVYTTPGGGITLTVTPAALCAVTGDAEVLVRIKAIGQFFDAEAAIPSRDLPGLIQALTERRPWSYNTVLDVAVELSPIGSRRTLLVVTADEGDPDEYPQIQIPEQQRLPLASALQRAMAAARGREI